MSFSTGHWGTGHITHKSADTHTYTQKHTHTHARTEPNYQDASSLVMMCNAIVSNTKIALNSKKYNNVDNNSNNNNTTATTATINHPTIVYPFKKTRF